MGMGGGGGGARGGGRRRGGRRGGRGGGVMSDINVTPLVDVMLVLLIVFMVAAPMMTSGVPIDLPQTAAKQLNSETKPITVSVKPDGTVFINDTQVAEADLITQLGTQVTNGTEDRIFLRGDTTANYGSVMKIMGLLSAAGYSKIGLITEQAPS